MREVTGSCGYDLSIEDPQVRQQKGICEIMKVDGATVLAPSLTLFGERDQKANDGHMVVISGPVAYGRQLGRTLGFPTANVAVAPEQIALTGVYAVRCWLPDGRQFDGVASLGCNPTIPKDAPVLEVWMFEFDEDIYGQILATELTFYLRDEEKLSSVEALREQVFRDADQAKRMLATELP